MIAGIAVLAACTVVGLVAMWPRGDAPELGPLPRDFADGTIVRADTDSQCTDLEYPDITSECVIYGVHLGAGADAGDTVDLSVRPAQTNVPDLAVGDDIVLRYFPDSPAEFQYAFADFQRAVPLLLLLIGFVAVVLAFGRLQTSGRSPGWR